MHRSLISAAVFALAGLSAHPALAVPVSTPVAQATTQLPRTVRPTHYDVSITPNATAATFAARATIDIDVLEPTSSITLNAVDLAFHSALLRGAHGKGMPTPARISVNADKQTASFTFDRPIAKGGYRLALDYTGVIGSQPAGLFLLDYDTPDGHKRALYTQFENSDARRMIPSWDEPAYKASFTLEATVPTGEMAVSNMPIAKKTDLANGRSIVRFALSPKMSTYLLFFGLGEFERATATVDGAELGVITQKGALPHAAFALGASQAILHEYNDYFGVRYPLPKLDNIAAPGRSQFFSAMENWGAIFTFEYSILLDPNISTQADKERAFSTEAHEMAHQWFGDLVTMQWWDDLWLNEGFASWMEGRTTARLHPEWNTALSAVNVREIAMNRDSVATTHPVVQHIDTVEQASQAFDAITYDKGESVIGMLESYVGADAWRDGVRAYMKAHAYGNTTSEDLWREIDKAAGKPITAIAHDFTLQAGVPMIRVDDVTCRAGTSTVSLSQAEFSRDRPDKKPLAWRVPVIIQVVGSSRQAPSLVTGGKVVLTVPGCGAVLVNAGQTGYYRTLYAPQNFGAVAGAFAGLAPIDQLGVMSDSWSLGLAGLQPMSDYLDLAKATPPSADPQVWSNIASVFGSIYDTYRGDPQRQKRQKQFSEFAIARLSPMMAQVGWNAASDESGAIANLREKLINTLSLLGDPATIAEARRRYAAQASDPNAIPAALRKAIIGVVALRKAIIGVVALHADAATWDALHATAQAETSQMIKDRLYDLLATTEDEALAKRALALALTAEPGATNSAGIISRVAAYHPDLAFDFAVAHLAQVNELIDNSSRSRYFPRLASGSSDPAMVDKLILYANNHLPASARRDADTAVAGIKFRIKVQAERLPAIDAWLAVHP
jgi:aminopeptidase N